MVRREKQPFSEKHGRDHFMSEIFARVLISIASSIKLSIETCPAVVVLVVPDLHSHL